MRKKREEKILDEIRKRVIETDRERSEQQDENSLREANVEALEELTSLSKAEIKAIENKVRQEEKIKYQKRRKTIIYLSAFGLVILLIFLKGWKKSITKIHFKETFTNNVNKWDIFDDYSYKRSISDGRYNFQANTADWCYWDNINLNLPKSYVVEAKTIWTGGKFNNYGIIFLDDDTNYGVFNLTANGTANYARVQNKEWVINEAAVNKAHSGGTDVTNIQRIEVMDGNFNYYVNGNLVSSGSIDPLVVKSIGFRVCDLQKVSMDYIKITDLKTNNVIFEDDFSKSSDKWKESTSFTKKSEIKDGNYTIFSNSDGYCCWGLRPFDELGSAYDVTLKCIWKSGETADFGLIYLQDDDNYFTFEIRPDGNARYARKGNGVFEEVADFANTGIKSNGDKEITLKVKIDNGKFEFYVENQLIQKASFHSVDVKKIGMRVCGRQTVSFSEFTLDEK